MISSLHKAWEELRKHPNKDTEGLDGISINDFLADYSIRIEEITEKLLSNKFRFQPLRRTIVEKGREILIQSVEERIVSEAILQVIGPSLEKINSNHDFSRRLISLENGVKPKFHGIPLAVEIIQNNFKNGYVWVLEADIKGFFDNVPKKKVFELISKHIKDSKILELIKQVVYFTPVVSNKKDAKQYDQSKGIAQGSPLSPLLASIYLYEFDKYIVEKFPHVRLVRYVDDFIILCKDEATAKEMYQEIMIKLADMELGMYALGEVNKNGTEKTKITCAKWYGSHSFDFLGLSFNYIDIDITSKKKLEIEKKLREIINAQGNFLQKTRRIESRLRGYIEHYKWRHYTRTVPSLVKIINFSQIELRKYYVRSYKGITRKEPFEGFSNSTINNLYRFMGIDFNDILKLATSAQKNN